MVDPIPLNRLVASLGLDAAGGRHHVAIVGGGGKTTLVHALGRQLTGQRILTCTTKMGHDQHRGLAVLLSPADREIVAAAGVDPVMVWKRIDGQKAVGVEPQDCDRWFALLDHVVVEADGSRQRPFKAPATFEPVVPATTTLMLSVIGADALGRVIADQCHRPLRVAALAGCGAYERLTPAAAATVLLHERGARKESPDGTALAVVVTKVDDRNRQLVGELVDHLAHHGAEVRVVTIWSTNASPEPSTGPAEVHSVHQGVA